MKKRLSICVLTLLLFSSCTNGMTADSSTLVDPSNFIQSDVALDMVEATLQEAENINEKSWMDDVEFMQTVDSSEVGPTWSYEMPMGLIGKVFPYPYDGEQRLTQIFFAHDIHESGESYSLFGIHLGDSFLDAEKRLLEEGYVLETESHPTSQSSSNFAKERYYTKYHITIDFELDGENEDTATIRYMSCIASDPNAPDIDGAID